MRIVIKTWSIKTKIMTLIVFVKIEGWNERSREEDMIRKKSRSRDEKDDKYKDKRLKIGVKRMIGMWREK